MKRRVIVLILSSLLLFIMFIFSLIVDSLNYQRIILAIILISVIFLSVYFLFGTGKLITTLIYGMMMTVLLTFFQKYDTALIFIFTFILFLNPLHNLEEKIDEKIPNDMSVIEYIRGSYKSYFDYRRQVKEYYHLPQVRKMFVKPNYLKIRQALTLIMAMFSIFLLLTQVNDLINLFKDFSIHAFFGKSYSVLVLLVLTVILYRKGFQSMMNFVTVSIFPPISYILYITVSPFWLGVLLGTFSVLIGTAFSFYQYLQYRGRIVFEHYYYYDTKNMCGVYANALYEPYMYDENFRVTTVFRIPTTPTNFSSHFHTLYLYSDYFKFFISAYTTREDNVSIYTDFHYRDIGRVNKFKNYLESLFGDKVLISITEDIEKETYTNRFYYNDDYIVARTLYLAETLKRIEIKSSVVLSFIVHFSNLNSVNMLLDKYHTTRLVDIEVEGVYAFRLDIRTPNDPFLIETKTRDLLLDLLITNGSFVRVNVLY